MLFFVGLGIDQSPSANAIRMLEKCDEIFLETYTSPRISDAIGESLDKRVQIVSREFVEDGRKMLELAAGHNVALVSSGDPMIATTHLDLRIRALKKGIITHVIHSSSILSALPGELGLHAYSFGKCVTITREPLQLTAYETIFQNLLRGLHTTILLEWDESSNFFLEPREAMDRLESAERDLRYGIITEDTLVLGASRLGSDQAKITATRFGERSSDFGTPPISLVIPGRLHFTEGEALAAIFKKPVESFRDNSAGVGRLSRSMVERYSERTYAALDRARAAVKASGPENISKIELLFENVECYTDDAARFMNQGKDELAVLSIGYAEGLLDALRFLGMLSFDW